MGVSNTNADINNDDDENPTAKLNKKKGKTVAKKSFNTSEMAMDAMKYEAEGEFSQETTFAGEFLIKLFAQYDDYWCRIDAEKQHVLTNVFDSYKILDIGRGLLPYHRNCFIKYQTKVMSIDDNTMICQEMDVLQFWLSKQPKDKILKQLYSHLKKNYNKKAHFTATYKIPHLSKQKKSEMVLTIAKVMKHVCEIYPTVATDAETSLEYIKNISRNLKLKFNDVSLHDAKLTATNAQNL